MANKRSFNKSSIKDVARLAAVSVTTVSHVVSGTKGYSQETIQRVNEAIQHLNYVPSYAANALQKRASMTIGVCARDPFARTGHDARSYLDRLWAGILQEADQNNYKVMHFPRSIQVGADAGQFLNGQIDGLIIFTNNRDLRPARLASAGLPVVMVARYFDIPEGIDSVAVNEKSIVELGLNHLRSLGHTRIAYVAGPVEHTEPEFGDTLFRDDVAVSRLAAYESWMKANVSDFQPISAFTNDWHEVDLSDVIRRWIGEVQPSAIFAANDNLARSVLRAAGESGIKVPEQLSVLGIDNDLDSSRCQPRLTTIDVPVQEVGRQAVRALLLRLGGETASPIPFDVPVFDVTVRESTGPAPRLTS